MIIPGTARLAFTIALDSEDASRTVVQNIGRAIVKKLTIKISGNKVMSIDDSDIFHCYNDLWKTAPERVKGHYQGIDASDNRETTRIRVGAGNGESGVAADKVIADAFGDRFFTPLDFELLESHMPFYQSALGDRLEYELNDYGLQLCDPGRCRRLIPHRRHISRVRHGHFTRAHWATGSSLNSRSTTTTV